jgi:hypothetical protein
VNFAVGGGVRTYADNTVARTTTYWYRIFAAKGAQGSAWSNVATVTTP